MQVSGTRALIHVVYIHSMMGRRNGRPVPAQWLYVVVAVNFRFSVMHTNIHPHVSHDRIHHV